MNRQQASEKLHSIGQDHLLNHFDQLNDKEKESLLAQIEKLHIPTFREQQQLLTPSPHPPIRLLDPVSDSVHVDDDNREGIGKKAIKEGKVGCLLIAGGQGSRLNFQGPKGCFPISVIKNKSLFQLFAEKILAAGKEAGRPLPLAVMTSPLNHEETVAFFKEHQLFGLDPSQLSFFRQEMLPILDDQENMFLDQPGRIAEGPDGNGSCFKRFFDSGIWDKWYEAGVRLVNTVLVDNPLADPFDAQLIGFHADENADVVLKCTTRRDAEEKVGLIVKHNGHVEVIEYSEIKEADRNLTNDSGDLLYNLANLSLFSFSMDFIKLTAHKEMPLHLAHKAVPSLANPAPQEPNAWKFETFIFDALQYATKIKTLIYSRESCFSPLKNGAGKDSVETVKKDLQRRDREVFEQITGNPATDKPFELSQQFYYPTEELLTSWKGLPFPEQDYIE